jgi:cation diffusion facilitator CzcD-associated flavoprotein CzcO
VAIIGAGPSGLAAAKFGLEAGFHVTVFEASDRIGGQWHTTAPHSGVWPGMHTNTSRAMTAFSDLPAPPEHPLHPAAEQVHAYLEAYADRFDLLEHVRFETRVREVRPGWTVDEEPFDAVVVASGRFHKPRLPPGLDNFQGELLHTYDYPGASAFMDRPVLVYGNGISGVEIASDLAPHAPVISAFRKSRYVIQKVVEGVSSDWQWYTLFGALERRQLAAEEWSQRQRERVVRVAGAPDDFGAPAPDRDLRIAGLSLCQDYLAQIRDGEIVCRPAIATIDGHTVTFTDGSTARVETIICATGYDLDISYLREAAAGIFGADLALYQRTFCPDLPGLAVIGQFLLQGPYLPLLELQARWISAVWSGETTLPSKSRMRQAIARPRPLLDAHNALALALSEELGVSPDPADWPDLAEPLLFGPMLPPRYRMSGPGAQPEASARFAEQLAASPRAPVDPDDLEALGRFGWSETAEKITTVLGASQSLAGPG